MATRYFTRSVLTTTKQTLTSAVSRSYTTASSTVVRNSDSFLFRLRPLVTASCLLRVAPAFSTRCLSTRPTTSSLNDPNPNWSNRPPKETILLDGCDFEHWLVVMEKPEGEPTRDEIIDSYIKTLASVVGSEQEARMKIYSVSTRHYFAFGALVSEELSYKLKELPKVRWVLPDSYLDVRNKDYGGEPFINGEAVPYDPKYHEEWVRNNARANERNRRNDRPRNFDRSRNFERRRDGNAGGPGGNMGVPPPYNTGAVQPNIQQQPNMHQQQPNIHQQQPNMGGQPNYSGGMQPPNNYPPNNMRGPPNSNPSNFQYGNGPNDGGRPYQSGPGPNPNYNPNTGSGFGPNMGPGQGQNPNSFSPNAGGYGAAGQNQSSYVPNTRPPPGQNQTGYAPNIVQQNQNDGYAPNMGGGNPHQNQNMPGRDLPQPPNY
ncbi:hypothetical protein RD792_007274 [Penstemon davidsonii]|uniref:MORF/ORRM1/DAG-like MORF domain-containing protein n=1 Tax=Penstemon davidsonii TaxID=160366 RepID=A0ABR0D640_9LAMI|nr:hypothetical protein RD792_007274 [Penstemon davidsonii]